MVVILTTSVHVFAADNGYARDYDDDPHCCDDHEMSTFMSVCNNDNVNDGHYLRAGHEDSDDGNDWKIALAMIRMMMWT